MWPENIPSTKVYTVSESNTNQLIKKSFEEEELIYGKKPLQVGVDHQLSINPENSGEWTTLSDGTRLWRQEFYSKNALALSIAFDEYELEEGARLFIYDFERRTILGAYNEKNNKKAGNLPTSYVPGDRLIVELQISPGKEYGRLNIGSISHAIVDITGTFSKKDLYFGTSGYCEVDINCPEGFDWQTAKRSVCRIIFKRSSTSTDLCTGTLINTTFEDGRAYFYTANHCISTDYSAENTIFYFNLESEECEGSDPDPNGTQSLSLASATLLATSDSLDFSLLELSLDVPDSYAPYYSGWSISENPPENSATIHHPYGDVKKISKDDDPAVIEYQTVSPPTWLETSTPGAFWRIVEWDLGTTEGGSSGSPLFNQDQLIVGNLTGGDANCYSPQNDYYSKFHMDWDYYSDPEKQLKHWLDSLNTGKTSIEGYDPVQLETIFDYLSSSNDYSILSGWIEGTEYETSLSTPGLYTFFAACDSSILKLPEWYRNIIESGSQTIREEFIGQFIVKEKKSYESLISSPPEQNILSQAINFSMSGDSLILNDSILVLNNPVSESNGFIHPIDFNEEEIVTEDPYVIWEVYPNPNNGRFFIHSDDVILRDIRIRIYDRTGRLLSDLYKSETGNLEFDMTYLPRGIYILEISVEENVQRKKIVISEPAY